MQIHCPVCDRKIPHTGKRGRPRTSCSPACKATLDAWRRPKAPDRKVEAEQILGLVLSLKQAACLDCGVQYPPYVMDFDHRPGTEKKFSIARARSYSLRQVKLELEKCDLVCSNCHRERTWGKRHSK